MARPDTPANRRKMRPFIFAGLFFNFLLASKRLAPKLYDEPPEKRQRLNEIDMSSLPKDGVQTEDFDLEALYLLQLTTTSLYESAHNELYRRFMTEFGRFYDALLEISSNNTKSNLYRGLRKIFVSAFSKFDHPPTDLSMVKLRTAFLARLDKNQYDHLTLLPESFKSEDIVHIPQCAAITETALRHSLMKKVHFDSDLLEECDPKALEEFSTNPKYFSFSADDYGKITIMWMIGNGKLDALRPWLESGVVEDIMGTFPNFFTKIYKSGHIRHLVKPEDELQSGDGAVDEITAALIIHTAKENEYEQAITLLRDHAADYIFKKFLTLLLKSKFPTKLIIDLWKHHLPETTPLKMLIGLAEVGREITKDWLEHPLILGQEKTETCLEILDSLKTDKNALYYAEMSLNTLFVVAIISAQPSTVIESLIVHPRFELSWNLLLLAVFTKLEKSLIFKMIDSRTDFNPYIEHLDEHYELPADIFVHLYPRIAPKNVDRFFRHFITDPVEKLAAIRAIIGSDPQNVLLITSLLSLELWFNENWETIQYLLEDAIFSTNFDELNMFQLLSHPFLKEVESKLLLLHCLESYNCDVLGKFLPFLRKLKNQILADLSNKRGPKRLGSFLAISILSKPLGFKNLLKHRLEDICHFSLANCMKRMNIPDSWAVDINTDEGRPKVLKLVVKKIASGYTHFRWAALFILSQYISLTDSVGSLDFNTDDMAAHDIIELEDILKEFTAAMTLKALISLMRNPSASSVITKHLFRAMLSRPSGFIEFLRAGVATQDNYLALLEAYTRDLHFSSSFLMQFYFGHVNPDLEPRIEAGFKI